MALVLLEKHVNKAEANHIELLEYIAVHKSWWDSIDMIAAHLMGAHFKRFPEQIEPITQGWMESGNIWLQRCALLFQLKYKQTTDTERLYSYIIRLTGSKEFFINKAIGWVLREYSKTDPQAVREFVEQQALLLSPLSIREALKVLNRVK